MVLLGGLVSCGQSDADAPAGRITFWHGYTDVESDALRALGRTWNREHPDTPVQLVFDGGNDGALQKTVTGGISGKLPDLAYEYGSSAAPLARQPRLVDLTEQVRSADWNWSDFFPAARSAATVGDQVIGVPALIDNLALVYNKKVFAQAGIAPPTDTWSWADFRAAAKQLTDSRRGRFGWAYVNDGTEDTVWRYVAMLWQAGGDLLTSDDSKAAFDSRAGLAALTQLQQMAVDDHSVYLDTGSGNYLNLFNSGKLAMMWTGPWDLSSVNSDVDYGVTYLPGYQGNHESIAGPDVYVAFTASPAQQRASLGFLKWLTSPEVHLQFAIDTGDLPLRTSETQLPGYAEFLAKYPGNAVFVDNLDNVEHSRPTISAYGQVSSVLGQMVQSVLLGQAQPADALRNAARQVDVVLEQVP